MRRAPKNIYELLALHEFTPEGELTFSTIPANHIQLADDVMVVPVVVMSFISSQEPAGVRER